jgi:tetratricopeptide (TPR) repeat protein
VRAWSPASKSLESRLDALREQVGPLSGRILIGVVRDPSGRRALGLASYREGLLVVAATRAGPAFRRVVVHELAHLFGAVHVPWQGSVMTADGSALELDARNTRLVSLHRGRRFASHLYPLPQEVRQAALALYRELASEAVEAEEHVAALALEQGDPAAALVAAERLLREDQGSLDAAHLRGIALRRLGRLDEAIAAYQAVLERRPGHAAVHFSLAIAFDRLGESERALAAYERALALQPGFVPALSNLARLRARRGEATLAIEAAQRALTLAPDYADARVNLAMAYLAADDPHAAEREAKRAAEERPESAETQEALGAAALALGRPEQAAAAFRQALALQPDERFRGHLAVALRGLARQRRGQGDALSALTALREATQAAPHDADAWAERADLAFEQGRLDEASEAYARRVELRPDDAASHNNLAVVLFRSGDRAGARRHLQAARRLGVEPHPEFVRALEADVP